MFWLDLTWIWWVKINIIPPAFDEKSTVAVAMPFQWSKEWPSTLTEIATLKITLSKHIQKIHLGISSPRNWLRRFLNFVDYFWCVWGNQMVSWVWFLWQLKDFCLLPVCRLRKTFRGWFWLNFPDFSEGWRLTSIVVTLQNVTYQERLPISWFSHGSKIWTNSEPLIFNKYSSLRQEQTSNSVFHSWDGTACLFFPSLSDLSHLARICNKLAENWTV